MKFNPAWLPLLIGFALGCSSSVTLPVLLGQVTQRFGLSASQGGLLGTLELSSTALVVLLASRWPRLGQGRALMGGVALAILLANLISTFCQGFWIFVPARAVAGIGYGLLLADLGRRVGHSDDPQQLFALQQIAMVVMAILFYTSMPSLIAGLGTPAPFAFVSLSSLLFLLSVFALGAGDKVAVTTPIAAQAPLSRRPLAISLSIVLLCSTYGALWAYLPSAALQAGIGVSALSTTLAVGALANLLGAIAAERIGLRWGFAPVWLMLALAALARIGVISGEGSLFLVSAVVLPFTMIFVTPYFFGLLALLDRSGRAAAAGPGFLMIGNALGPLIGGLVIACSGLSTLGMLGLLGCVVTFVTVYAVRLPLRADIQQ
ncbi:MFS transporter [Pseudomonas putida]|uniref:MFS transporter n=1 Tax=Pseudomonas putida TaxID=303 RepID=A0A4D6XFU0_PSEPU|nr:MFS transporter [Pseudomonas putida]QCI13111.1 MFS transporter [Pseudomonas putida]